MLDIYLVEEVSYPQYGVPGSRYHYWDPVVCCCNSFCIPDLLFPGVPSIPTHDRQQGADSGDEEVCEALRLPERGPVRDGEGVHCLPLPTCAGSCVVCGGCLAVVCSLLHVELILVGCWRQLHLPGLESQSMTQTNYACCNNIINMLLIDQSFVPSLHKIE